MSILSFIIHVHEYNNVSPTNYVSIRYSLTKQFHAFPNIFKSFLIYNLFEIKCHLCVCLDKYTRVRIIDKILLRTTGNYVPSK